jgi:hypothetical protein
MALSVSNTAQRILDLIAQGATPVLVVRESLLRMIDIDTDRFQDEKFCARLSRHLKTEACYIVWNAVFARHVNERVFIFSDLQALMEDITAQFTERYINPADMREFAIERGWIKAEKRPHSKQCKQAIDNASLEPIVVGNCLVIPNAMLERRRRLAEQQRLAAEIGL